jgi:hypothetical protein
LPIVYGAGTLLGDAAVVGVVWAMVFFELALRHLLARCPRCHEFFNWSGSRSHRFPEECTHWGLKLHAALSADADHVTR